jgi:hypothetical protein
MHRWDDNINRDRKEKYGKIDLICLKTGTGEPAHSYDGRFLLTR